MSWLPILLLALGTDGPVESKPLAKAKPLPASAVGWFGIFPYHLMYGCRYEVPVIDKKRPPRVYRQTALYEWTGGRSEAYRVTLARDPAFKEKHAPDALRKLPKPPEEVKVKGDVIGWLWRDDRKVPRRILVPLADDKALLAEVEGMVGAQLGVLKLAQSFDLDRAREALSRPPRRPGPLGLDDFRAIRKGAPYRDVLAWLGAGSFLKSAKDADGNELFTWRLADSTEVRLGLTPGFGRVVYVRHAGAKGKVEDLAP
jgi:hypothetical protein